MVGGVVNHVRTVGKLERRWHTTGQSADGTTSVDFRLSLLIARVPPGGAISYIISVWAYEVKLTPAKKKLDTADQILSM